MKITSDSWSPRASQKIRIDLRLCAPAIGSRAQFGFSVFDDADDQADCNGHGTHIAGEPTSLGRTNSTPCHTRSIDNIGRRKIWHIGNILEKNEPVRVNRIAFFNNSCFCGGKTNV